MMFASGLITVFLIVVGAVFVLVKFATNLGLLAFPGEHRTHENPTPMVGGIAIFSGLVAGVVLVDSSFIRLVPCLLLMCVMGVLDDRYTLPSWTRFLAQGIATYLMIKLTGVQLQSLGNLFYNVADIRLDAWSVPMTIFASIGVINAVNMSDGLDGLAGSMVLLVLLALMFLGTPSFGLAAITAVCLIGFLAWNLRVFKKPARVYLGDAGSMMLGLLLAYLLIEASQGQRSFAPVTALWLLALPLIDAVAVLIARPLRGKSPFLADRTHYHHHLADRGLSVNCVLFAALSLQIALIGVGIVLHSLQIAEHWQLTAFLALFFTYLILLLRITKHQA